MPTNDPQQNPHGSDDRWSPEKHSLGNPDRADPRDSQAISLSPHLHRDLSATLSFFTTLSDKLTAKLEAQLPRLRGELETTAPSAANTDKKIIDPDLTWNVIQDSSLLSKSLTVVETLQVLLHDTAVIRDSSRRKMGEVPIQLLISKLRDLSHEPPLDQAGCQSPVNNFEYVDVSLKGIFSRHKDELGKLLKPRA